MDFGVSLTGVGPMADPERLRRAARKADQLGFYSLSLYDHVAFPTHYSESYGRIPFSPEMPFLDPITTLSYLAAETPQIRLCTGILLLALRHPLQVAKSASTLDVLSGGRMILGVGLGWLAEEFEALGVPFSQRAGRLRESVGILKTIWRSGKLQHEGRYFRFAEVGSFPRPLQPGGPPIWFGGAAEGALKRAVELGDGWLSSAAHFRKAEKLIAKVRELTRELGKDSFTVAVGAPGEISREEVDKLQQMGASHINLSFRSDSPEEMEKKMEATASRLRVGRRQP